ncbi:MAG: SprT-like domain-containing protein [Muribaculaceae bacterium]|nr:SprT-like domain-containing protein [Muribaculaceae bacterium]
MRPDINFVGQTFDRYNAEIFNSSLPVPKFVLTKARTFRGKLVYQRTRTWHGFRCHDFEMRISVSFDSPQREWEDVVIHEMIHLCIASRGIEDQSAHGPEFRKMMNEINRVHSRNISVSTHTTPEEQEADTRIRAHYLCLAKFSDGRLGVAPVAKSRVFELWESLERFPGVESISWLGTTDPWFNRFPRVLKPKFYIVEQRDVVLHLSNSLRLERRGGFLRAVNQHCSPDELLP